MRRYQSVRCAILVFILLVGVAAAALGQGFLAAAPAARSIDDADRVVVSGNVPAFARAELEIAQRGGNWSRAGELTYGVIPKLEAKLTEASKITGGAMINEEVRDNDIAAVVKTYPISSDPMLCSMPMNIDGSTSNSGGCATVPRTPGRTGIWLVPLLLAAAYRRLRRRALRT